MGLKFVYFWLIIKCNQRWMKKIIFVEKEDNGYDPVAAFFNKKAPSAPKSMNSTAKTASKLNDKKMVEMDRQEKPPLPSGKKIDDFTPKIGKKGENEPASLAKPYPLKDQIIKSRDGVRNNPKKQSKTNLTREEMPKIQTQKSMEEKARVQTAERERFVKLQNKREPEKDDSIEKMKEETANKPIKKEKKEESAALAQKVIQLEQREREYLRKLEEYEAKEQKFVKGEQRFLKMQKDLKLAAQRSKQSETAAQKLKQKQAQIKQMLEGSTIPFNRRREIILCNKIGELKRQNRELTLRIKNYKGSDVVQMATHQNRQEICRQLYTVDVQKELKDEMNANMQSLLVQLINKLNGYIEGRVKDKGEKKSWITQQTFLIELAGLAQKISLNFLNNYDISPLPKSSEEAVSVYSLLEEYKNSNNMKKLIDKYEINLIFSNDNARLMESLQQGIDRELPIKRQMLKGNRRKQDPKTIKAYDHSRILEKRSNLLQTIILQNLCQTQFLKQWLQKSSAKVGSEIATFSKMIRQIRDIVSLGSSASQSLFLYLEQNIQKLEAKLPQLKNSLKLLSIQYSEIQSSLCQL